MKRRDLLKVAGAAALAASIPAAVSFADTGKTPMSGLPDNWWDLLRIWIDEDDRGRFNLQAIVVRGSALYMPTSEVLLPYFHQFTTRRFDSFTTENVDTAMQQMSFMLNYKGRQTRGCYGDVSTFFKWQYRSPSFPVEKIKSFYLYNWVIPPADQEAHRELVKNDPRALLTMYKGFIFTHLRHFRFRVPDLSKTQSNQV